MTRKEHATQAHEKDDIGYGLGGCQALTQGYPDISCRGCQAILAERRRLSVEKSGRQRKGGSFMYARGNPRTKKILKERVDSGQCVEIFSLGPFPAPKEGETAVEGPHYPEPHRWYARVRVENGRIVKVLS